MSFLELLKVRVDYQGLTCPLHSLQGSALGMLRHKDGEVRKRGLPGNRNTRSLSQPDKVILKGSNNVNKLCAGIDELFCVRLAVFLDGAKVWAGVMVVAGVDVFVNVLVDLDVSRQTLRHSLQQFFVLAQHFQGAYPLATFPLLFFHKFYKILTKTIIKDIKYENLVVFILCLVHTESMFDFVDEIEGVSLQTGHYHLSSLLLRYILSFDPVLYKRMQFILILIGNFHPVSDSQPESHLLLSTDKPFRKAVLQVIDERLELNLFLGPVGHLKMTVFIALGEMARCKVLDVEGVSLKRIVLGGGKQDLKVIKMCNMRLQLIEKIVQIVSKGLSSGHEHFLSEELSFCEGLRGVDVLMVEQRMSPNLHKVHQIDLLFLLFCFLLDVAVDFASLFFSKDMPDFLLIHVILSNYKTEVRRIQKSELGVKFLRLVVTEARRSGD